MALPFLHKIRFLSPTEFALEGPGVSKWRKDQRIFDEGAPFSPAYKNKIRRWNATEGRWEEWRRWDGYHYPGKWASNGIYTLKRGMLDEVQTTLSCEIVQPAAATHPIVLRDLPSTLRDYQVAALHLIVDKKWGRLAFATNAGKGAIIALAALHAARSGHRVLILCDEISVYQALEKECGIWTGSDPDKVTTDGAHLPDGAIVLAMVPTLYARIKRAKTPERRKEWRDWLKLFSVALLDEADKASAPSWKAVLEELKNTHYRIGFSGTFIENEESPVELANREWIGPILLRIKNSELIDRGISARPLVELVPCAHRAIEYPPKDIWHQMTGPLRRQWVYDQCIIRNDMRHALIESLLDPDEPNAVIVNYVEHGRLLAAALPGAQFLYGEDSPDVRAAVLASFKAGDFKTLVVSKILDRGTNELGHAVGLIFASSQGSLRQTLQRVGRGLRRTGGKEFLFLKDIMDSGHPYFDKPSAKRLELYNAESFEITIRSEK